MILLGSSKAREGFVMVSDRRAELTRCAEKRQSGWSAVATGPVRVKQPLARSLCCFPRQRGMAKDT